MGGLFGPLGGLEELPCASTLAEAPAGDDVVREVRADDGTVYIQLAPQLANRVWQLSVGTSSPGTRGCSARGPVTGVFHCGGAVGPVPLVAVGAEVDGGRVPPSAAARRSRRSPA